MFRNFQYRLQSFSKSSQIAKQVNIFFKTLTHGGVVLKFKKKPEVYDVYKGLSFFDILWMKNNQSKKIGESLNRFYFYLSSAMYEHRLPEKEGGIPIAFTYRTPSVCPPTRVELIKGKLLGVWLRLRVWFLYDLSLVSFKSR